MVQCQSTRQYSTSQTRPTSRALTGGLLVKKLAAKVFGDIKNDLPRFVRYVFWGAITAFFNLGVYLLLTNALGLHYLVSNTVAWVLYVVAAFFTNKLYVFGTRGQTALCVRHPAARQQKPDQDHRQRHLGHPQLPGQLPHHIFQEKQRRRAPVI